MSEQQSSSLQEKAARAFYEEFFAGLIGCAEQGWDDLPEDSRELMVRAQGAAIAAVREHLSEPSLERLEDICGHGLMCGDRPYKSLEREARKEWRRQLAAAFEGGP